MKNQTVQKTVPPQQINYIGNHATKNSTLIEKTNAHKFETVKTTHTLQIITAEEKIAQQQPQDSDNDQIQLEKIRKISEEMRITHQSWRLLRDQSYVKMGLQGNELEYLNTLRAQMSLELDHIAMKLNTADELDTSNLVKSMAEINSNYDVFIQNTLGPNRYKLISGLRNKFNENIKSQTESSVQISTDW